MKMIAYSFDGGYELISQKELTEKEVIVTQVTQFGTEGLLFDRPNEKVKTYYPLTSLKKVKEFVKKIG